MSAITVNPKNFPAYYGRGEIYLDIEDYEQALRDFNKALELVPKMRTPRLCADWFICERKITRRQSKIYNGDQIRPVCTCLYSNRAIAYRGFGRNIKSGTRYENIFGGIGKNNKSRNKPLQSLTVGLTPVNEKALKELSRLYHGQRRPAMNSNEKTEIYR